MTIYAKKVHAKDQVVGKPVVLVDSRNQSVNITVKSIFCNNCRKLLYPECYLVYMTTNDYAKGVYYDIYCIDCIKADFPNAKIV